MLKKVIINKAEIINIIKTIEIKVINKIKILKEIL
jgi:hypothetical protein